MTVNLSRRVMIWPVALAGALSGCGEDAAKDKDKDEKAGAAVVPVTSSFLTSADFSAGAKVSALTRAEMQEELDDTDDFYANAPDETPTAVQTCTNDKLKSLVATADTSTLKFGGEIDVAKCLSADPAAFADYVSHEETFSFKIYFAITCVGGDLSGFAGKTFTEVSEDDTALDAVSCTSSTIVMNTLGKMAVKGVAKSDGGKTYPVDFAWNYYGYWGDGSGKPCTGSVSGEDFLWPDGCLQISRSHNTKSRADGSATSDEGAEDYVRLESASLVGKDKGDSRFFKSGKFKVQINDWTGEMVYAGVTTAPTWTMATSSDQATGTFGTSAGATLRSLTSTSMWPKVPAPRW